VEQSLFYIFASLAVASSLVMVTQRNPVTAAMNLVVAMFSVAALFVLLNAHFLAAIQLLIYAGAVMVLFVFVILLLNLQDQQLVPRKRSFLHLISIALVIYATLQMVEILGRTPKPTLAELAEDFGTTEAVGKLLFSDYLLPFELTSILILGAIVGAVVLAKRRLD
jgi:NADH-quinone oxidoreductase subunit J